MVTDSRADALETVTAEGSGGNSTRARIVQVAAELFAERGYDATGIADLLAAAQISRGAFYYHIDSKETLLFEISKTQVDNMNAIAGMIAAGDGTADDKIHAMARSLIRNISDHRAEWAVFFRELPALTGERRTEILTARDDYEAYWLKVLREGAANSEFVPVTPLHVKGILGMLNYTYLWIDPHGKLSPEELADTFTGLLLNGLLKK
jgi:AcrR family transcriptional regulator